MSLAGNVPKAFGCSQSVEAPGILHATCVEKFLRRTVTATVVPIVAHRRACMKNSVQPDRSDSEAQMI